MPTSIEFPDVLFRMDNSSSEAEFLQELVKVRKDIYLSVLSVVGCQADADDVFQEVCITLWQKFDEFEPESNFRKWACAFAFNLAKAHVKKKRRVRAGMDEATLARIVSLHAAGSELFELRRELLRDCLAKLSPKDRQFLLDRYRKSGPLGKLAGLEGIPIATVYTRLKRLRHRIVQCVDRAFKGSDASDS